MLSRKRLFAKIALALAFLALAAGGRAAQGDLTIYTSEDTKRYSDYAIAIADDAAPAEIKAAQELSDTLLLVGSPRLGVFPESNVPEGTKLILVGPSKLARRQAPDVKWDALGDETTVIKTVGDSLILAGGRPRGTLYAVYSFLEDVVGVRWWTYDESACPRLESLVVPPLDVTHTPSFASREIHNGLVSLRVRWAPPDLDREFVQKPAFAAHLKLNGDKSALGFEHGGCEQWIYFVHSFYRILRPEIYFEEHPEWFSLIKGKRTTDRAQLCLTNEAMRDEFVKNALKEIAANPNAGYISISQNDWRNPCQCDECQAIAKREGSESGPMLDFVNHVAAEIEKEYPDILVETLAYQYTRKPPKTLRPRRNVIIRLCSIECDFSRPLASEANAKFGDDIRAWSKIAPRLYIWNYTTNFRDHLLPHPNLRALAPDLRFFEKHNAIGVFEEGEKVTACADFVRLKLWLMGRLMWDTSRDENALIDEFLSGYYGPAAPHLREYLDLIADAFEASGKRLSTFNRDASFLTPEVLRRGAELFDKAQGAVADDPTLATRVDRERISLDYACFLNAPEIVAPDAKSGADMAAAWDAFLDRVRRHDDTDFTSHERYEPRLKKVRDKLEEWNPEKP